MLMGVVRLLKHKIADKELNWREADMLNPSSRCGKYLQPGVKQTKGQCVKTYETFFSFHKFRQI